jgi:CubicO group peptidase (beta-lactamase class C family)
LLMHLRGGLCGDEQVLSQDALDTMHADRIAAAYDGSAGGAGTGYGMGWWIDRASGRISDAGAYGTVPWLDLEDGYGAYLVVESTSGNGNALADQLYAIVDDAVNAA